MKKRTLSIVIALVMIFGLMACSNQPKPDSNPPSASGGTNPANEDTAKAPKEEYVINYLYGGAGESVNSLDTKVGKVLKEKLNVVINITNFSGDWDEKCALMLAGGDYPEILSLRSEDMVKKYIEAGALLELEELANQYGPNFLKRHKDTIPFWKLASNDGKLYKYEHSTPNMEVVTGPMFDVLVRSDVLEAQGWPELLDEDSYVAFLKKGMQQFPEINGQKTVGMTLPGAEAYGIQGIVPIMYEKGGFTVAAGNGAVIYDHINDKYVDYMMHSYVKASLQFFNRLYREGILDPECFTDLGAQSSEKLVSGRALAAWYITWEKGGANTAFAAAGRPDMEYVIMPIMSRTQLNNGDKLEMRVLDTYAYGGMGITKNCKDPQRMMELLDFAATEEGQILLGWGIEGDHYTIENNRRIPTAAFKEGYLNTPNYTTKEGITTYGFLGITNTFDANGQIYNMVMDESVRNYLLTERNIEVYGHYGWKNINDPWRNNKNFQWTTMHTGLASITSIQPSSDEGRLAEKLIDFRVKNTVPLIMAKDEAAFEALYAQTIGEYEKLNPKTVIDKYNEIYQANKAKIESLDLQKN